MRALWACSPAHLRIWEELCPPLEASTYPAGMMGRCAGARCVRWRHSWQGLRVALHAQAVEDCKAGWLQTALGVHQAPCPELQPHLAGIPARRHLAPAALAAPAGGRTPAGPAAPALPLHRCTRVNPEAVCSSAEGLLRRAAAACVQPAIAAACTALPAICCLRGPEPGPGLRPGRVSLHAGRWHPGRKRP